MTKPVSDEAGEPVPQPVSGKAVIYTARGGYDVIRIIERTVRAPAAGEVRIRVQAAAVNPTDIVVRDPGRGEPPLTPGMDAAGHVEAVGRGVPQRLRVGDAVMAAVTPIRAEGGAQAAHIIAPAASVVPIPKGVSLAEASTLPMNGLTALSALEIAGLSPGKMLAVSGGAGLLACYTIAIAKRQGLRVIADAKPDEFGLVRSYGADVVVSRGPGFAAAIRAAAPEGVDALLDTALLRESAFPAIRDGGVCVSVRRWDDAPSERGIQVKLVWAGEVLERTEWLEQLRDMAESGVIKLRVTGEYAPEQVADAQRALTAGGLRGRPVIIF
ncbi:quinone oxidoreductase family protein [Sabulicella glaciei]|uniref:NADP-dependent oxidoreductase n=1 Tax=Sabulicella glaciei TaxID=2984948 RepID=A0ABT3NZG6_9PROT|nr:NADP-dependent oxidoreductase [Roseococcus sp. MDT2-1-1]MCW8087546.1 NADP-dependent oxidoreductase [Roseococcus sp. MDT2-1-1]